MLAELLRLLAEIGPGVIWVFIFIAAVVAVFVVYIGIALWATCALETLSSGRSVTRYSMTCSICSAARRRK